MAEDGATRGLTASHGVPLKRRELLCFPTGSDLTIPGAIGLTRFSNLTHRCRLGRPGDTIFYCEAGNRHVFDNRSTHQFRHGLVADKDLELFKRAPCPGFFPRWPMPTPIGDSYHHERKLLAHQGVGSISRRRQRNENRRQRQTISLSFVPSITITIVVCKSDWAIAIWISRIVSAPTKLSTAIRYLNSTRRAWWWKCRRLLLASFIPDEAMSFSGCRSWENFRMMAGDLLQKPIRCHSR